MRTVWKHQLQLIDGYQPISTHEGSNINLVGAQEGRLCLWVQFDDSTPETTRWFVVKGTGHSIPENCRWVGSCQMPPFVWHVYEVTEAKEDK